MSFLSYLVGLLSHHLEISSPYKKPLCHFGPLVLSTQNEHAGGTLKILNSSNQTEILSDFADKFTFKTQIAVFSSLVTHCRQVPLSRALTGQEKTKCRLCPNERKQLTGSLCKWLFFICDRRWINEQQFRGSIMLVISTDSTELLKIQFKYLKFLSKFGRR